MGNKWVLPSDRKYKKDIALIEALDLLAFIDKDVWTNLSSESQDNITQFLNRFKQKEDEISINE